MLIIDRFENNFVVFEYKGKTYNFPKDLLPSDAKEGDVLNVIFEVHKEKTDERKKKINDLMNELFT